MISLYAVISLLIILPGILVHYIFFSSISNVHDPRALTEILEKAEADLAARAHPDPYRRMHTYIFYACLLLIHVLTQLLRHLMARNGMFTADPLMQS